MFPKFFVTISQFQSQKDLYNPSEIVVNNPSLGGKSMGNQGTNGNVKSPDFDFGVRAFFQKAKIGYVQMKFVHISDKNVCDAVIAKKRSF